MILNERIDIFISYRNITHYVKIGYKPILNKNLNIETIHLPTSSHVRIDAVCEICKSIKNIQYCKYLLNRSRHGFYGCKKCSRQKSALTSISRYGVDNYSKTEEWKEKVESTNMIKYGYKTNLISPEYIKNIKCILKDKYGVENWYEIRNGNNSKLKKFIADPDIGKILSQSIEISESLYRVDYISNSYILYRNECRRISESSIKYLYDIWDGIDYYDKESICDNFNLDHNNPLYPTIDHKTPIYYGFINKIPPSEIGCINNLCITKRCINSSKRDLTESEFIEKLKSN